MTPTVIAGIPTHLRHWGQGPRPVLALHCSLAHGGAWRGVAERLRGVRVTAPDLPGHGRCPEWDGQSDLHGTSTRLAIALAETEGRPVDLLGHSFGGTVALRLALERPELVRSLTLIEPVLFAAARAAEAAEWPAFLATHHVVADGTASDAEATAAFHAVWGEGEFARLPKAQRDYMARRIRLVRAQDTALVEDSAGMLAFGRLEGLGLPVLLLEGGESPPIVGAILNELERRLPMVRRSCIAGAGHMLPITHPEDVAAEVQAHLDAH